MEQTTTFRLPISAHREAQVLGRLRGVDAAEVLRDATRRGLDLISREEQERAARMAALAGLAP